MKISILLPLKENFSPSYPGAVSLFINDTLKSSKFRKEILLEIKGVKKVIPSDFIIKQKFLDKHKIDILISGSDYKKRKFKTKSINSFCFFFDHTPLSSSPLWKSGDILIFFSSISSNIFFVVLHLVSILGIFEVLKF